MYRSRREEIENDISWCDSPSLPSSRPIPLPGAAPGCCLLPPNFHFHPVSDGGAGGGAGGGWDEEQVGKTLAPAGSETATCRRLITRTRVISSVCYQQTLAYIFSSFRKIAPNMADYLHLFLEPACTHCKIFTKNESSTL